jgi:hypothetical protein
MLGIQIHVLGLKYATTCPIDIPMPGNQLESSNSQINLYVVSSDEDKELNGAPEESRELHGRNRKIDILSSIAERIFNCFIYFYHLYLTR